MVELFAEFWNLIVFAVLFGVGYIVGSFNERRHYRSIEERERVTIGLPVITMDKVLAVSEQPEPRDARLVMGNVVVSIDYFKRVLASLRNLFGGRVTTYETLVDRARREALLRMKEKAKGAEAIINVRIETSAIGASANRRGTVGSVEAIAYGTALFT